MSDIKQFYDQLQFPGHYTIDGLNYHKNQVRNPYLKLIDRHIEDGLTVLDAGCGTGLISNLFALRYPLAQFTAIDFANGVIYGRNFARIQGIKNVKFERADITNYTERRQYDLVICQGVLHHIPDSKLAIDKLKKLVKPGGKLILGVYHPWGKIAKRYVKVNYNNEILYQDQELNPYETSYSAKDVRQLFPEFDLIDTVPGKVNIDISIAFMSLFNFKNGGLVTYVLEKTI